MKATIYPSKCNGIVKIPPSKSVAHRAIICACLSSGKSIIRNIDYSEDIIATIECMKQLGATVTKYADYIEINGINDFGSYKGDLIDCSESGSTLRFLIPIFSLTNKRAVFTGKNRLLHRPQSVFEDLFKNKGLEFSQTKQTITINGALQAGEYELEGGVSSQFISGLLFVLPILNGDSIIKIKPPFESKSYIDITIQVLNDFGIKACFIDENTISIKGNQRYKSCDYTIEGDFSQLGFFAVLAAINNDLTIVGMNNKSLQGDKVIIDILKNSGVKIEQIENGYKVYQSEIKATDIDLSDCPDLGPILTVLAMYAKGKTKIYNAKRLRYKESDRIFAMETELKKFGVDISSNEDEILINSKDNYACERVLSSHKDHRIAMSLSVALTKNHIPCVIEDAEYINKSYPNFFEDLKNVGIRVELKD